MTTHSSSLHLHSILYCVYGSVRFNSCYCSGTLKGFKSNQPVLFCLYKSMISVRSTGATWMKPETVNLQRKKKELRGREKLRSGSGTQRMTISYSMQSSTSIRKWQAALWLHHCHCPHTVNLVEFGCVSRTVSLSYSSSTMRSLRTSCWKGKTWGHLSLPWWMWSFCAVKTDGA